MRFAVERKALSSALDFLTKYAAMKEKTIPVLASFLIRAESRGITVAATNLEQYASERIDADVSADGGCCLPGVEFSKFIKAVRGGVIVVDVVNDRASISCGVSKISLPILLETDFPTPFNLEDASGHTFTIPGPDLTEIISQTAFAYSKNDVRFYLQGFCWRAANGQLETCATDGLKLSLTVTPLPVGASDVTNVIVPEFDFAAWQADVTVSLTDRFVRLQSGAQTIVSKLIEGSYPDYHRMIPQGQGAKLLFDRTELLSAVTRAAIVGEDGRSALLFVGRDGEATISGRTLVGETTEAARYEGDDFVVAVSSHVIIPVLKSFDCEMVELSYSDPSTAVVIRDPKSVGRLCLAAPFKDARLRDYEDVELLEAAE